MKTIRATILDPTHLELSQPLSAAPGESIEIVVVESEEAAEDSDWQDRARDRFLKAYDDEDAIYDDL